MEVEEHYLDVFYYCKIQFRIPVDVKQKFLTERKYIVFESSLFSLLKECPVCHSPVTLSSTTNGTLLKITRECASCSLNNVWHSQPIINDYPAGNLLMSTGILSAGLLPQKTIRLFEFMNCATISRRTFFVIKNIQLLVLFGQINSFKCYRFYWRLVRSY